MSTINMICIHFILFVVVILASFACGWYLRKRWIELPEHKKKRQIRFPEEEKETEEKETEEKETEEKEKETQYKETVRELKAENERLVTKVAELEQLVCPSDNNSMKNPPKLVGVIITKASKQNKSSVTGITLLEDNLYVITRKSSEIEVYDSKTFNFENVMENLSLGNPLDITSSNPDKCLYVIDRADLNSKSEILKLDFSAKSGKKWSTECDWGRLSTYESNLVVCFSTKRVIIEYSPYGERVNTIRLSPGDGFKHLWHAIKLTGTHFVVSHRMHEKNRHRVCVIDAKGAVLRAFEELPKFMLRMNFPMCLTEYRNKSVLVADTMESRIFLLSSNMKFERKFIETQRNLSPVRLCFNETSDRLFVVLNHYNSSQRSWNDSRIFVYKIT